MFREMRRKKQQAEEAECLENLRTAKRGVLAVLGDDDYPYAVPLDFVFEDGCLYFHCAVEGHKLDAVRKHEKVSFCVLGEPVPEKNDWWFHVTSVIAFGRICEVKDPAEHDRCLRLLARKYMPLDQIEGDMQRNAHHAVVLALHIEHMTGKHVREK